MKHYFIIGAVVALLATGISLGQKVEQRSILIAVSDTAPLSLRQAAQDLAAHPENVPALRALMTNQGTAGAVRLVSSETLMNSSSANEATYNHLVVIGLRGQDPLLDHVDDLMAKVDPTTHTFYSLGYGNLQGDVGWVESGWNPYLHSQKVHTASFDTCLFQILGTSEQGTLAALKAFEGGLINGAVPGPQWSRGAPTLLDRDPELVACPLPLPAQVPMPDWNKRPGEALQAGWTQPPENEYRAYIDFGGEEPQHIWRVKYLRPGNFNKLGPEGETIWGPMVWLGGFHTQAFGTCLNIAGFDSPAQAEGAYKAIVADHSSNWKPASIGVWKGSCAPFPTDEVIHSADGNITLFTWQKYLIFSSLSTEGNQALASALQSGGSTP